MPVIFNLTATEEIVPEPVFRSAIAVDLSAFMLMDLRFDAGSVSVQVEGLEGGVTGRSLVQALLDAARTQQFFATPVLPADVANDLTSDQAATGGTVGSVVKSGAGWTTDEFAGKVIVFTGGTNGNADGSVRALVANNTSDTINFSRAPGEDFAAACDNTTTFRVHASARRLLERSAMLLAMDQLGKAGTLD